MDKAQHQVVEDQLARILAHSSFSQKNRLSAFLRFVVANTLTGDLGRLKETLVGVEVYGRDPSYNPKESPIVRTEARRLRILLDDYYAADGLSDPVLIRIPKGSYVAHFEFREVEPELPNPATAMGDMVSVPAAAPLVPPASPWLRLRSPFKLFVGLLSACLIATAALTLINANHTIPVWSAKPFSLLGGIEEFGSFSPDGRTLAFVWSGPKGDNPDIYVQGLKADAPTRLTSDPAEDTRPAWSPDGRRIAFIRLIGKQRKELDFVTLATGRETKVVELEGGNPWLCIIPRLTWSRDGKTLFTSESMGLGEACGLVSVNLETHNIRRITEPPAGVLSDLEPDVSPDGRSIAFLRNAGEMGGDIYHVGIDGGPVQRLTFDNRDIIGFCWSADGKSIIAASRRGNGVVKLWQMDLGNRSARQLSDGLALVAFPATDAGGDRIAFTSYRNITTIWRAGSSANRSLISEESGNSNPQLSPDGRRLLFRSDRTGAFEIWVSDRDGSNPKRLTFFNGPMVSSPVWSPDSKQIAFECRPEAHSDICLMSSDGRGETTRFTHWTSNEILPSWSRDGRSIYYTSNYSGRWEIYRQSLSGGDGQQITHQGGMRAVESWDGRYLYVHRGVPLGGIVRLPVKTESETWGSASAAGEQNVYLSQLSGGAWGDWDAGPEGIVFLNRSAGDIVASIDVFNPDTRIGQVLLPLESHTPQGDLTFSVEPGGKSYLFVKTEHYGGELGMLERHSQNGL